MTPLRARLPIVALGLAALVAAPVATPATAGTTAPGALLPATVAAEDAVDPLAPVPPGTIPEIPAEGLRTDQAVVLIDGVVVPSTLTAEPQDTLMVVGYGDGTEVYVGAEPASGNGIARLGGDGALRLPPGGGIFHTGPDGAFESGSTIRYYLFGPAEVDLGSRMSDPDGTGSIEGVGIPADRSPGTYTLQLVSRDAAGRVRVVSVGARLRLEQRPSTAISWPRRIVNPGTTRLLRTPVVTNAGKTAKVRYHCTKIDTSIRKPGLCRFSIDDRGWLRVTISGEVGAWIWIDLSAPGAPGYSRYSGGRILRAPL